MCTYIFIQNKKHMLSIEACCFIEHVFGKNASTYVYMGTAVHVDVSLYGLIPPCTITCGSRGIWGFPLENQNLLNSHSKIIENMHSPTTNTIFLCPPPKKKRKSVRVSCGSKDTSCTVSSKKDNPIYTVSG